MSAQSSLLLDILFVLCNSYGLFLAVKITSFPSYFPTISSCTWIPFYFLLLCDFFACRYYFSLRSSSLQQKKILYQQALSFYSSTCQTFISQCSHFAVLMLSPLILRKNVKNTVECICWVCYPLTFTVCLGRHKRWH